MAEKSWKNSILWEFYCCICCDFFRGVASFEPLGEVLREEFLLPRLRASLLRSALSGESLKVTLLLTFDDLDALAFAVLSILVICFSISWSSLSVDCPSIISCLYFLAFPFWDLSVFICSNALIVDWGSSTFCCIFSIYLLMGDRFERSVWCL